MTNWFFLVNPLWRLKADLVWSYILRFDHWCNTPHLTGERLNRLGTILRIVSQQQKPPINQLNYDVQRTYYGQPLLRHCQVHQKFPGGWIRFMIKSTLYLIWKPEAKGTCFTGSRYLPFGSRGLYTITRTLLHHLYEVIAMPLSSVWKW